MPFRKNGKYAVLAIAKLDGRLVATSPIGVQVGGRKVTPPDVGDRAPVIHTLTPADVAGNVAKIDTRVPAAPSLLRDDFADVVGKKPVVITFATPQLCQSRVCGPVVDVVDEVQAKVGDKVSFIHQEVYQDNQINKGLRPQLVTYRLQTEPWTFVIDKNGVISTRFEGAFSANELERAVAKVDGGRASRAAAATRSPGSGPSRPAARRRLRPLGGVVVDDAELQPDALDAAARDRLVDVRAGLVRAPEDVDHVDR